MEKGWSREGGMAPNGWLLACLLDSVGEGDGGWPVVLSSLNLSLSLALVCVKTLESGGVCYRQGLG